MILGNLDAKRDWGYAPEYVEGMWRILQHKEPLDIVLATGKQNTVREFVELAFKEIDIKIKWIGSGLDEYGVNIKNNKKIVYVDSKYYRPTEVASLLGDPTLAREKLGWKSNTSFESLVQIMVRADIENMMKNGN